MDIDTMFYTLIAFGLIIWFIRWIVMIQQATKATQNFKALLPALEQRLSAYQNLPQPQQVHEQPNLQQMLLNMNTQFDALNKINRMGHEAFVGRLNGIAAQAGIPLIRR